MNILIETASPAVLPEIASLAAEIWHEHYDALLGPAQVDYMLEHYQSVDALTRQLQEGYTYLTARQDGKLIGFCGYHPEEERLFLSKLYVEKAFRGRGISRMFLEKLRTAAAGKSAIYLTVNKENEGSIAVYRKLGFRTIDAVTTDIGQGYVMDDYIMELPLC